MKHCVRSGNVEMVDSRIFFIPCDRLNTSFLRHHYIPIIILSALFNTASSFFRVTVGY